MGLFRCQQPECSEDPAGRLIFDFEAAEPVCPKCGSDARKPEHSFVIVKREIIHLHVADPNGPDAGFGKRRRLACQPNGSITGGKGKHATGEVIAVTCAACKQTPEFKALAAQADEWGTPPELDFQVEVDREKGKYVGTPVDGKPPCPGCPGK